MAFSSSPNQTRRPQRQVAGVFETPVLVEEIADSTELNKALRAVILKRKNESEGISISNIGGWHSDAAMLDWGVSPQERSAGASSISQTRSPSI